MSCAEKLQGYLQAEKEVSGDGARCVFYIQAEGMTAGWQQRKGPDSRCFLKVECSPKRGCRREAWVGTRRLRSGDSGRRTLREMSLRTHTSVTGLPTYHPYITVPYPVLGCITLSCQHVHLSAFSDVHLHRALGCTCRLEQENARAPPSTRPA